MLHDSKSKSSNKSAEFRRFAKAIKQIVSVPKEELERREMQYKQGREAQRKQK